MTRPAETRHPFRSFLSGYVSDEHGISRMTTLRFAAVLFCYLAAFVTLAADPFFQDNGIFVYRQGIVTVFFAFVVTAALNWEMLLFGRASGANMLLQVLQIPPLTLLLARLTAFPSLPSDKTVMKKLLLFLKEMDKELIDLSSLIPDWFSDLFSNWRISLCFMLVLFILSFRNLRLKVGLLVSILVILLAGAVVNRPTPGLLAGAILLIAGYAAQFCRYDRVIFFENAIRRMTRTGSCDSRQTAVMLTILSAFYETGRLSRQRLLQLVQSVYAEGEPLSGGDLQLITAEVVRRMVYQYDLAVVNSTGEGEFLVPNPRLFSYDNLLGMIAAAPRLVLTLVFCLLWVVLPLDLIPDGFPVFGVLDDTAVTLMTGLAVQHALPIFRSQPVEKSHSISQS